MSNLAEKLSFHFDPLLDKFSKKYENILGLYRKSNVSGINVVCSDIHKDGHRYNVRFPDLSPGKSEVTKVKFSQDTNNVRARFNGVLVTLKDRGCDSIFLNRVKALVSFKMIYKYQEEIAPIIRAVTKELIEDFKIGKLNNYAKENVLDQYMSDKLDLFLVGLERLLGFERMKDSKGNWILERVQKDIHSEGAIKPSLFYKGTEKPFVNEDDKSWGEMSPQIKGYYRSLAVSKFKSELEKILKSGEDDRYCVYAMSVFSKRLLLIRDDESPLALVKDVIGFYLDWFRLDKLNDQNDLFVPKYLFKASILKKSSKTLEVSEDLKPKKLRKPKNPLRALKIKREKGLKSDPESTLDLFSEDQLILNEEEFGSSYDNDSVDNILDDFNF
jgi:hypothetical protein